MGDVYARVTVIFRSEYINFWYAHGDNDDRFVILSTILITMTSRRHFLKSTSAAMFVMALPDFSPLFRKQGDDFSFNSAFMRIQLSGSYPRLLYFSTDSLGQGKLDNNPLLVQDKADAAFSSMVRKNRISYYTGTNKAQRPAWEFTATEKKIVIRSANQGGATIPPFEIMMAQKKNHSTVLGRMNAAQQVAFPCILHLPGMGSFRISCNQPGVTLWYDAFRFDSGSTTGEPFVGIRFAAASPEQPELVYTMESVAIYPDLPAIRKDARFDGYRKNYLNIFQMNPRIQALANNSASDACTFTLYLYAEMARYTPPLTAGLTAMDLIRNTLERYLGGMKGYGQVGYKGTAWASEYNSTDSLPSLVMSACYYILDTKELEWARTHYSSIKAWATGMMASDTDGDGLTEYGYSGNSGSWDEKPFKRPANWWDTIGFGHADAYSNALVYKALVSLVAVAEILQEKRDAAAFSQLASRLKSNYYNTFFNSKTGVLAGWKSKDGQLHDYYFTFVNSIAVCYDLLTEEQAAEIMTTMTNKMKEVGFTDFRLGIPGNLIPIADADYAHHDPRWGYQRFGVYENGGASACYAYFTLHALYKTGKRKEADAMLHPMMESFREGGFEGNCPGSGMTKDWKTWTGECWGYEGYLVDNYLTLLAVKDYNDNNRL